jgi:hypothetical protein
VVKGRGAKLERSAEHLHEAFYSRNPVVGSSCHRLTRAAGCPILQMQVGSSQKPAKIASRLYPRNRLIAAGDSTTRSRSFWVFGPLTRNEPLQVLRALLAVAMQSARQESLADL